MIVTVRFQLGGKSENITTKIQVKPSDKVSFLLEKSRTVIKNKKLLNDKVLDDKLQLGFTLPSSTDFIKDTEVLGTVFPGDAKELWLKNRRKEITLEGKVAAALMSLVSLDNESNGVLSFIELRDAMTNSGMLISNEEKVLYNQMTKAEKCITQKSFIQGLHLMHEDGNTSTPHSSLTGLEDEKTGHIKSEKWSPFTIYRGLKIFLEAREENGGSEIETLGKTIFYLLDLDSESQITLDLLCHGLKEIDPKTFSSKIISNIVKHFNDNDTSTISEETFITCFSTLSKLFDMSKVRTNIENYKKKSMKIKAQTTHLKKELEVQSREAEILAKQNLVLEQENIISQQYTKELLAEKKKMQNDLESVKKKNISILESKEAERKRLEDLKFKVSKMEKALKEVEERRRAARSNKEAEEAHIALLQKDLHKKKSKLRKTSKILDKQSKHLKIAERRRRNSNLHLDQLSKTVMREQKLAQEKQRLQEANDRLKKQNKAAKNFIHEKKISNGDDAFSSLVPSECTDTISHWCFQSDISSGRSSPLTPSSPLTSSPPLPMVDKSEFDEIVKDETIIKTKVTNLEGNLQDRKRELDKRMQILRQKEQELRNRNKALQRKDRELHNKDQEIKQEVERFKPKEFKKTDDPTIYQYGDQKVKVQVIGGQLYAKVNGAFFRVESYTERYQRATSRVAQQEQTDLTRPRHRRGGSCNGTQFDRSLTFSAPSRTRRLRTPKTSPKTKGQVSSRRKKNFKSNPNDSKSPSSRNRLHGYKSPPPSKRRISGSATCPSRTRTLKRSQSASLLDHSPKHKSRTTSADTSTKMDSTRKSRKSPKRGNRRRSKSITQAR